MAASIDTNAYKGDQAVAISTSFVVIAAIFVAARLVVRLRIVRGAGADDWVILGSLVSVLILPKDQASPLLCT